MVDIISYGHTNETQRQEYSVAYRPEVCHKPVLYGLFPGYRPLEDVPELVQEKTVFLAPNTTWKDSCVQVETYGANDEGIALWCHVDGVDIYHSGDLNNWYWGKGQEDPEAEKAYYAVLDKLAGHCFDIAFIPVDPRLGDDYYRGLDDFMKKADARHIYPMHFWYDYSIIEKVKALPCTEAYRDRIANIVSEDDFFVF